MEPTDNISNPAENKISKSACQQAIKETEDTLGEFKNQYPRTVGDCFRFKIWQYVFFLGVFLWTLWNFHPTASLAGVSSYVSFMTLCFLGHQMGKTQAAEKAGIKKPDPEAKILKLQSYTEFPDIKRYVDTVSAELDREKKHKKMIKFKAAMLLFSYVALLATIIILVNMFYKSN